MPKQPELNYFELTKALEAISHEELARLATALFWACKMDLSHGCRKGHAFDLLDNFNVKVSGQ